MILTEQWEKIEIGYNNVYIAVKNKEDYPKSDILYGLIENDGFNYYNDSIRKEFKSIKEGKKWMATVIKKVTDKVNEYRYRPVPKGKEYNI